MAGGYSDAFLDQLAIKFVCIKETVLFTPYPRIKRVTCAVHGRHARERVRQGVPGMSIPPSLQQIGISGAVEQSRRQDFL